MTRFFATLVLLAGAIASVSWSATAQGLEKVEVRIGWNAFAGAAPISGIMQQQKLFEKYARESGYEVTAQWTQFIAGPPANEALVAGRLDLDMDLASAAYVARIRQEIPAVLIGTQASHLSNAIMVRPDSDIKSVADLEGKTVGLLVATSAHYTLASIVKQHLNKTLDEANIRLVNIPPADAIKLPEGIDAAAIWVPFQFFGPKLGLSELLIDANGFTGKAHENPEQRTKEVESAWGYPEGYFTDRLYITAHKDFVEKHPDLVVAFLLARWEAQDIVAQDLDKAVGIANEIWKQPDDVAKLAVATYPENSNIRDIPLLLEYDALSLIKTSEFFAALGTIDAPLTWEEIEPIILPGAELQRRAWEKRGSKPTLDEMRAGFEGETHGWPLIVVNGGEPVWRYSEVEDWGKRFYKPGPFGQ